MKSKNKDAFQKNKKLKEKLLKQGLYVNTVSRGSDDNIEYLIVSNLEPLSIPRTSKDTCLP
jgi:cytochrome b involved in lipid metabolism